MKKVSSCNCRSVPMFPYFFSLRSPFDYPPEALRKKREIFILSLSNFREAHVALPGTPDIPHFIGWRLFVLPSLSEDVRHFEFVFKGNPSPLKTLIGYVCNRAF